MPAGTIALTNNSKTVAGTATSFTTELKVGDFVGVTVGNAPYTMIISSIDSDTHLTIGGVFNGPTSSGLAWYGVPASLMFAITQQTLNDMASNLRGMTSQMDNWQKIYSDEETVTVVRPDRSTFTGPSWGYIRDLLNSLDVDSISEIAGQIHADVAQVATDKPVIVQAKTDAVAANAAAQQAKSDAQTASGTAQQAKTDATTQSGIAKTEADRAKTEADRAAASNPANYLLKSSNLSDVANKAQALINLQDGKPLPLAAAPIGNFDAVTKKYTDDNVQSVSDRITAVGNRVGYALITTTANLALKARMVLANPFGNNVPVMVMCEIFHASLQKWVTTPWVYNGSLVTSYGVNAAYSEGEGIVIQSGTDAFVARTPLSGSSQAFTADYVTPSPIRVHVWKVQS